VKPNRERAKREGEGGGGRVPECNVAVEETNCRGQKECHMMRKLVEVEQHVKCQRTFEGRSRNFPVERISSESAKLKDSLHKQTNERKEKSGDHE